MTWRRAGRGATILAVAAFALSACSSGGKGATSTTGAATTPAGATTTTAPPVTVASIPQSRAGSLYSAATQPAVTAIGTFTTQANAWTSATTKAEAQADAQPVLAAVIALEPKLQTLSIYYPDAAKDLKAEIAAAGVIQGDIVTLSTVNFADSSTWTKKFTSDVATLTEAGTRVQADLGQSGSS
jgi:hypothetical protein